MLSLLLLIILFVLYSQLVGQAAYSYFPEILGKIKYKWPIGFFIILGLIQLVSFPLQVMHVSMQVVAICYALIFLILSIFVFRYLLSRNAEPSIFCGCRAVLRRDFDELDKREKEGF